MMPLCFLLLIQTVFAFNTGWTFTELPPSNITYGAFYLNKNGTDTFYNYMPGYVDGVASDNLNTRTLSVDENGTYSDWVDYGTILGSVFYRNVVGMYNGTYLFGGETKYGLVGYTLTEVSKTYNIIMAYSASDRGSDLGPRKLFAMAPMEDGKFFVFGGYGI